MDKKTLEQYSSAFSLSDMEIFIFPDLMYSLVLANISSPIIWEWRNDPWFGKIEKKSFSYKLNRVKQYIMDHYVFNLDLDTWGLSTKDKEINRFKDFISMDALAQSNALFGYQGDKYYFSMDIRRHFGLDKYDTEQIPYWKTETVETMTAFKYKENYGTGAGECVSLAALYIAAMYIVAQIPLEKMYMIATPLHSQNFIAENDGFMTNNRRIVTKSMWYNGTEISAKARRAVEYEKISIISHCSGYIHGFYPEASIDPQAYDFFKNKFTAFLNTDLTVESFANYLYSKEEYWSCFQYKHNHNGKFYYVSMEEIFNAQRTSKNRYSADATRLALLQEMEIQSFSLSPLKNKAMVNDFEAYLIEHPKLSIEDACKYFSSLEFDDCCVRVPFFMEEIEKFLHMQPNMPILDEKTKIEKPAVSLALGLEREEILEMIRSGAEQGHELYQLALYAYRDMRNLDWEPFVLAALDRNPVCVGGLQGKSPEEAYVLLQAMESESLYDLYRVAQPDEVWNFQRGDGLEKAFVLATYLKSLKPQEKFSLSVLDKQCELKTSFGSFAFPTQKGLELSLEL